MFRYSLVISGAVYVGGDLHVDGSARFQNCHAESAGGAIYVDGDFWQSGLIVLLQWFQLSHRVFVFVNL